MTALPTDFDAARRILELAEKRLSEEKGSIVKPPQTLEDKLAASIAKAFEDDNEAENAERPMKGKDGRLHV